VSTLKRRRGPMHRNWGELEGERMQVNYIFFPMAAAEWFVRGAGIVPVVSG
jgi:hypothetical protein